MLPPANGAATTHTTHISAAPVCSAIQLLQCHLWIISASPTAAVPEDVEESEEVTIGSSSAKSTLRYVLMRRNLLKLSWREWSPRGSDVKWFNTPAWMVNLMLALQIHSLDVKCFLKHPSLCFSESIHCSQVRIMMHFAHKGVKLLISWTLTSGLRAAN